jgi:hypothetical protein
MGSNACLHERSPRGCITEDVEHLDFVQLRPVIKMYGSDRSLICLIDYSFGWGLYNIDLLDRVHLKLFGLGSYLIRKGVVHIWLSVAHGCFRAYGYVVIQGNYNDYNDYTDRAPRTRANTDHCRKPRPLSAQVPRANVFVLLHAGLELNTALCELSSV